jgi:hypothetical protein
MAFYLSFFLVFVGLDKTFDCDLSICAQGVGALRVQTEQERVNTREEEHDKTTTNSDLFEMLNIAYTVRLYEVPIAPNHILKHVYF